MKDIRKMIVSKVSESSAMRMVECMKESGKTTR